MSRGIVLGIVRGMSRDSFLRGREWKGMEGKNAEVVIHPQVEGDRPSAVSFPAMNELQR